MATLGLTTQGATQLDGYTGGMVLGQLPAMPENGTLNSIHAWMQDANGASQEVELCLYADSSGTPGALLATTGRFDPAVGGTPTEVSNTASYSLVSGAVYWVGFLHEYSVTKHYYDTVASNNMRRNYTDHTAGLPDPYSGSELTYTNRQLSAWIDYTAAGGTTYERTLSSAITVADVKGGYSGYIRELIDSLSTSDLTNLTRINSFIISELLSVNDNHEFHYIVNRLLSDSITVADLLVVELQTAPVISRVLESNLSVVDSLKTEIDYNRTLVTIISLVDQVQQQMDAYRLFGENVDVYDAYSQLLPLIFEKVLSSYVDINDSIVEAITFAIINIGLTRFDIVREYDDTIYKLERV